jgi:hypothetical protein
MQKIFLAIALMALSFAGACAPVTWIVTGTGDTSGSCSSGNCTTLRAAIASAGDGDTIQFDAGIDGGTILLSQYSNAQTGTEFGPSAFFITGGVSITIDGQAGLTRGITIARDTSKAPFRLFDVDSGSGLSLLGLTLKNGFAQGFGSGSGGGALGAGGAIFSRGDVSIDSCTFVGNQAQGGASGDGSGTYSGAGVGSAPINGNGGGPNGSVVSGVGGGFGGGGFAYDGGSDGSDGGFGGGGGAGGSGGYGGFGGGAGAASGSGSADGGFGGGGNNGTASGGGGAGMGGAIFNDAGALDIVNSTFTANGASGGAGGSATIGGSGFGGAIFNYSAVLNITSSTLARNSVAAASGGTADGGALYSLDDRDCSAGGNTCDSSTSGLDLEDSIFSGNVGTHDIFLNADTQPAAGTYAALIVSAYDNTQFTITNFKGSADPLLSPLANHGGWTPTMVPKQGSAAIDALTCTSGFVRNDQRDVSRPQGPACDIGAVEYDGDYIFANGFD